MFLDANVLNIYIFNNESL